MRVVGLISGGKDSCYNMMQCVAAGHEVVALANLQPAQSGEQDSYMFQTVGHEGISLYAEAMQLPLFQETTQCKTTSHNSLSYQPMDEDDEVEDLYRLLKRVKEECDIQGVSVGAILSDYQRVRVENVCSRLGLISLAYLWRRNQKLLLQEMIQSGIHAVVIKVACLGLQPAKHLGKSLEEMYPHLCELADKYGVNVCGEGGEYETFTLDCPLFHKHLKIDSSSVCTHSDDEIAPVAYLQLKQLSLVEKTNGTLVNQPVVDHSTLYVERLTAKVVPTETKAETCVRPCGPYLWLSISKPLIVSPESTAEDIMLDMKNTLLATDGSNNSQAILVYLYLRNMQDYAVINAAYAKAFASDLPARVCVQLDLPHPLLLRMDILFVNTSNNDVSISHLHVQSISHWAPANIGPYSQACKVGDVIFLAGQIGLVPGCMTLVPAKIEATVSLDHVISVLKVKGSDLSHILQGVCYCTSLEAVQYAQMAWQKAAGSSLYCPIAYPLVSGLPRGANVEWHFIAVTKEHTVTYNHSAKLEVGLVIQTLSAACSLAKVECIQLSFAPLATAAETITIPHQDLPTANLVQIYQPYTSPMPLKDKTSCDSAMSVLHTCGLWSMGNPLTIQALLIKQCK
ncbi:uncharacterized protein [Dysidea avara]|uniref:uncharacterized protein n=1 Tax=Dysidea avara TaxID=196820 RepID=UPI003316DDB7